MIQKNRSDKKSTGSAKTKRKSVSKSKTSAVCRKKSSRKSGKNSRVRQRNLRMLLICIILMVGVSMGCWYGINNMQERERKEQEVLLEQENSGSGPEQWQKEGAPYIDVELLTPNEYSRPQIPIESVKYIAIHYTANPGATAMANRNYFENLANTHETKVSSHFVIGLDGEVVQCIPTSEMSYATNSRNVDTVSIECCHQDETGKFNDATYDSAVKLTAWLCVRFGLTSENVIRHYDVTGKNCPKYYVENPDAWIQMKSDIAAQIDVDYGLQNVQ